MKILKRMIPLFLLLALAFSLCACGTVSTAEAENYSDDVAAFSEDSVPEGQPQPIDTEKQSIDTGKKGTCTLLVECGTILDNMEKMNKDKVKIVPEDGIIFAEKEVSFYEGESVFDVLKREMLDNKIHFEFEWTPLYDSSYVKGIANIYEFDCGELSGWTFSVNDWFPNYGASRYIVSQGDRIVWSYTCDCGKDVGADDSMTTE